MRALWQPGTRAYHGRWVPLPETTCYPRPAGPVPIIVGGSGEARTLRIAARLDDGCDLPSDLDTLDRKLAVLRSHCREAGRDPAQVQAPCWISWSSAPAGSRWGCRIWPGRTTCSGWPRSSPHSASLLARRSPLARSIGAEVI